MPVVMYLIRAIGLSIVVAVVFPIVYEALVVAGAPLGGTPIEWMAIWAQDSTFLFALSLFTILVVIKLFEVLRSGKW